MAKAADNAAGNDRQPRKNGRPTKVPEGERVDRAREYLEEGYAEMGDVVPTASGLAAYLKVGRSRIYDWATQDDRFRDMLDQIQGVQERMLISKGLTNDFNATIVKLMLSKHGYSDKSEVDHSSKDGSMSPAGRNLDDFYKDQNVPPES